MMVLDIRFSDWIQKGVSLFFDNWLLLALSGLVAMAITGITLGLLAGPMLAGMAIIIRTLLNDRLAPPTVNDLFRGFDYIRATIPVTLSLYAIGLVAALFHAIPGPGFMLNAIVLSVGGATVVLAVFHITERKLPATEALSFWWELFKVNWGPLLGFYILITVIGGIGIFVLYIGTIVTFPLSLCILGVAYRAIRKQSAAL